MQYVAFDTTSKISLVYFRNSSTNAGLTGINNATASLELALRRVDEGSCRYYTGANLLSITTLGVWADPGAGKIRIKEIDATNKPGYYEIQFENSVFATGSA